MPTCDADAGRAFFLPAGENIKNTLVAAVVSRPHPPDGEVAAVVVGGVELHVGFLVADTDRHAWLVRQEQLGVLVEPAHLADGVARCRGDVAAEHDRMPCLCSQTGRSCNLA